LLTTKFRVAVKFDRNSVSSLWGERWTLEKRPEGRLRGLRATETLPSAVFEVARYRRGVLILKLRVASPRFPAMAGLLCVFCDLKAPL